MFRLRTEVEQVVRQAGWTPTRCVSTARWVNRLVHEGYTPLPGAERILQNFGGLEIVPPTGESNLFFPSRISFDPVHAATIAGLAIRDGEGRVLAQFGPGTSPLPLNTDFPSTYPGGRDITQVPPGGSVYLRSNHIWGNNGLPSGDAGNEVGQLMTATLAISKEGPRSHLAVSTTPRIRERVFNPTAGTFREGETRSSSHTTCDVFPG